MTTTISAWTPSWARDAAPGEEEEAWLARYRDLIHGQHLHWPARCRKLRLLGRGGQGIVYLAERQGSDAFALPVALKFFSLQPYRDSQSYHEDMSRVAQVASRVAMIQHDNLLDIHNFIEQHGIRIMEMEWVDGFNLHDLLTPHMFEATKKKLP